MLRVSDRCQCCAYFCLLLVSATARPLSSSIRYTIAILFSSHIACWLAAVLCKTVTPLLLERMSYEGSGRFESTTRTVLEDIKDVNGGDWFDLGHPLLNRVAHSFLKAAGIGAVQSVSRQAYFTAAEGAGVDPGPVPDLTGSGKKHRLPDLKGDSYSKSLEAVVKNTGKEAVQWGLAAGVYSGLTYGLKEATGSHDWKNSATAGAVTGAMLALTAENPSHEQVVQCAVTGAAISTAANLLSEIF